MARKPNDVAGVFEKNPGSDVWYVRYRVGGSYVKKKIGLRSAAIDFIKTAHYIKASGEGVLATSAKGKTLTKAEAAEHGLQGSGVTVNTLCDQYLAHIRNPANPTRPSDQVNPPASIRAIKKAFGSRVAESIKPYEVTDWLDSMGSKPGTLNRYRSTFSSVYRYARERARVTVNPVRDTRQYRVTLPHPRWLKATEEARIRAVLARWVASCPAEHKLKQLYLRCHAHELTVAIGTGMRKGNQFAIRWDDHVDLQSRKITPPPAHDEDGQTPGDPNH